MTETLMIGTRGWDWDAWAEAYYPPALPRDWRLCYYSNELRAVLVPAAAWGALDAAAVAAWVEDTDPAFRFVLEPPPELARPAARELWTAALARFLDLTAPIRPQVAGYLLPVAADAPFAPAWLEPVVAALARQAPVCVDLPGEHAGEATLAALARHGAGLCWRPESASAPRPGGALLVACSREAGPRAQRRLVEALAGWRQGEARAALFFEGDAQAPAWARQARLVAELLGV